MSETRKTLVFCGVAVVLAALALVTAPKRITPDAFLEQGEVLFPDFTDPNTAKTLEVITYDEETGSAVPFKVTNKNGIWTIPSHHDYPADGKDRLAKTAAGVIGIKKDDFRSDLAADHEACGVIDPLDEDALGFKGRGQRVTIKGENDVVLADLVVGNKVAEREGMRFVRIPDQKRVYSVRMDLDISTRFADWIETDLLEVNKDDVDQVILKDYSINERTGRVEERGMITLVKHGEWTIPGMTGDDTLVQAKLNGLLAALDELKIEGVRPKPEGLTTSLTRSADSLSINTAELLSLQGKGYFFSRDGRLLSNEGEVQARTTDGLVYTLRFGEVVYGTGSAVTAGTETDDETSGVEGENRYLFVTVRFESSLFPEPPQPENSDFQTKPDSLWTDEDRTNKSLLQAHRQWSEKITQGEERSSALNARFAKWYYVISSSDFDRLRPSRDDLVAKKSD